MSYILDYCNAIDCGEIIVGQELKLMLAKLRREISGRCFYGGKPVIADFTASDKRIKLIESECKFYEAPFAGKPFKLELFQKAFIEAIFAIKVYDEELGRYVRKYKQILFVVGRKNGKTPLIGAIVLAEWFCGPTGLRVLCSSNDYEQAGLMFDAINAMREESPNLERVTRKNIHGIFFGNPKQRKKHGKFSIQNKGQIKKISAKTNSKEGRNIGIGAVDEVHEMKDDRLVLPIRQALSSQEEPLYFELTTEGFINDGYLDQRMEAARKVLYGEGKETDERWLIWLYTQDNEREVWEDETSWYKSNPGLGVIKKRSYLRELVDEARENKSTRAFVLAKEFNIKQNNASAWLSEKEISQIDGKHFNIDDISGSYTIGGCDLSETGDLTNARQLIVNPVTNEKYMMSMYFIPAIKAEENPQFKKWAEQGYIYLCDGGEVSYDDVFYWFVDCLKKYKLTPFKIGYDKWNAKGFVSMINDWGAETERIQQGDALSNAMTLMENDLAQGKIFINDNPVDRYCLGNMAVQWNSKGTRRQPVKVQGDKMKKIDGGVTMLICYETLDRYRSEYMELQREVWKSKNK